MSSLFSVATAAAFGGHQARGGGYKIQRSVRLRSSASAYFNRTPASATNRKTFTFSKWLKRGTLGSTQAIFSASDGTQNNEFLAYFGSNDTITIQQTVGGTTSGQIGCTTNAVFRDPSSWYHIVLAIDTTQATSTNRLLLYVNGVAQTFSSYSVGSSINTWVNNTNAHAIGKRADASLYLDGYMTEVNFIDGQALTPSDFGKTDTYTGVWSPKRYGGTYGTNGFYLNFSDNSAATAAAIGKDYSGLGNNWTPNNISVTSGATYDSMLDVPTRWADGGNGRGNYAVLSSIDNNNGTISNGNLNLSIPAGTSSSGFGNFAMTVGKWYWEVTPTNGSVFSSLIGVSDQSAAATNRSYTTANGWGYYSNAQTYYNNTPASYGSTFTTNDIIGVAYDADIGSLSFYKNGVSQGVAFSTNLFGKPIIPAFFNGTSSNAQTFVVNFGQRPFSYTPPSGFKALNTQNLPAPTILKGNQYFDATTYAGNGSTQSIVNSGAMQPNLVWVKKRSGIDNHELQDAVRGAGKRLASNTTDAEVDGAAISAFNSNGFSVGNFGTTNENGFTYVGWQWKEGATQGFDIVTYTGTGVAQNISHSLGVAPKMIIVKNRNTGSYGWFVWHTAFGAAGNTDYINLNLTDAKGSGGAVSMWNTTMPTSSVFSIGTYAGVNGNTNTYVAYLFSEVAGFSKFGSYTGNGSTDGPFVFCGFRPRWVMYKRTDAISNWVTVDTSRSTYNETTVGILPNSSGAETTGVGNYDILSNGFKCRNVIANEANVNGGTYIFAAFAEHPFKNALAR